ncbi:RNA polymerase factor sigma-32 [Shinella sumterensis]|uniref:RNA polymerase sigma factor n=1 Tax=Shinella sumterensis TaxID=1967501 RepID=A0AA50CMQ0_9HYPH|nr:RNA polymerase factor sigma-32 [Shinella sumterensis]MDP9589209.1 RNA polymerase sigma-32 factor [Shinella zoogloeoides]MCD1264296.1 RNA polymerase factor sigma-32 [Shinella sumterensis]TFE93495.1 RNA polymerase factor sigma-32 [Shinella sumterensis]WLR97227.1 RNA polymerase factor sigma-32 [Shinella sumterensis]WLS06868.1 RNA polymerase factor sigma-32 [Shinella sumterensis]
MATTTAERRMIKLAMSAPYLERDEEQALAQAWKNNQDQEARNRIAMAHMRLVVSMAGKFRNFGLPLSDLVQEGYIGLLEAAARFEPERQVRFSTYASWWIRASVQDYVLRNWSIVRGGTSSAQKALFFNLRRLRARLARGDTRLTAEAMHQEIAAAIGVSTADVRTMDARLSSSDISLQAPISPNEGEGASRIDLLASEAPLPDEQAEGSIDGERRHHWLYSALGELNEREMKIIRARRLAENGATLEELGVLLGISKERVRQIENRALEKLKAVLVSKTTDFAYA